MVIERKTLRSQVRQELLARVRSGMVEPGESINEVQLAAELGVSRTPLREALIGLESEGQITSENGKGFRFVKLTSHELEEIGPVIAALESLAIELTPIDQMRELGVRLAQLAADFSQNFAPHSLIMQRDDEWHCLMLSACPNDRLLDLITTVREVSHRFESLLVADEIEVERAAAEHQEIARHLIEGDIPGAKLALQTNWLNGVQRIRARADIPQGSA